MTTTIHAKFNADHPQIINYTTKLNQAGIKVRYTNAYLVSGKPTQPRIRVKLSRKNIPELSDKVRDVHQILKAIEISEKQKITLSEVFQKMNRLKNENPIEVHHEKSTLEYECSALTKNQHENAHKKQGIF